MAQPSAPPPSYGHAVQPGAYSQPQGYSPYPPQPVTKEGVTYHPVPQTEASPMDQVHLYGNPKNQQGAPPQGYNAAPQPGGNYPSSGYPMSGYASPPAANDQPYMYNASNVNTTDSAMEAGSENQDWAGASFSDKAIRRAFIRKVYLILTAQLLVTVAFVFFFLFHKPTKYWVKSHQWFYWCSYGVFLVTYIALACCSGLRRSFPANFICLGVFTVALSYMAATISSFYDTKIVLIAAGITAVVCLSITLFAIQTKIDFTMCGGLLFALCMVVFFTGIVCIIWYVTVGYSSILNCVYGGLAALLFSLFLAYDTQMLMGGRKFELSPEEYIFGALQLYLDVVYLFLIILSLFGSSK